MGSHNAYNAVVSRAPPWILLRSFEQTLLDPYCILTPELNIGGWIHPWIGLYWIGWVGFCWVEFGWVALLKAVDHFHNSSSKIFLNFILAHWFFPLCLS